MGTSGIAAFIATLIVGGAVGTAAVVGVVSSQTSTPDKSPANVEDAEDYIPYGTTD